MPTKQKMSKVLMTAPEEKHNFSMLVEGGYDPITKSFETYCAMGYLGCQKGLISETGDFDGYPQIIEAYGVKDAIDSIACPECGLTQSSLARMIIHLNDGHEWTFKKIGEFLKSVGY